MYLGAKRRYINTLPFLFPFTTTTTTIIIIIIIIILILGPLMRNRTIRSTHAQKYG